MRAVRPIEKSPPTLLAEVGFPALYTSYPGPAWGTIEQWDRFFVMRGPEDPVTDIRVKMAIGIDRSGKRDGLPNPERTPCTVRAPGSRLRIARPIASDCLGTWYLDDLFAPRDEYLIIDRVEHTSKPTKDNRGVWQLLFTLGERRVPKLDVIPPRQNYRVEIDFWSVANPGLVLFYGWRVHEKDYKDIP